MNCIVCAKEIQSVFYTTVDNKGNIDTYCIACYSKAVLDNHDGMVDGGGNMIGDKCECGTKAKVGQNHSTWCDFYRKELS